MLKINRSNLMKRAAIFFLIFPFIMPVSIPYMFPAVDLMYDGLKLISLIIILFLFIKTGKLPSVPVLFLSLFELWLSLSTLVYGSQTLRGNIVSLLSAVAFPFVIEYFSDDMKNLVPAMLANYEWMIYVCFASIILYYPDGMYDASTSVLKPRPSYFLGNENGIIFYVIPAIALALIYKKMTGNRFRVYCLIIISIINIIIVWCATALVGIALGAVLLVFANTKFKDAFSFFRVTIAMIVIDALVSVFRIVDKYGLIADFITNVLQKEVTLSGRTYIWDVFYETISGHWLLGFGRGNHVFVYGSYEHCHNEYFQILVEGGIPALFLFFLFIIAAGHTFNRHKNTNPYYKFVVYSMVLCLLVQFIATARVSSLVYVPLMLPCYIHKIKQTDFVPVRRSHKALRIRIKS